MGVHVNLSITAVQNGHFSGMGSNVRYLFELSNHFAPLLVQLQFTVHLCGVGRREEGNRCKILRGIQVGKEEQEYYCSVEIYQYCNIDTAKETI